MPFTTAQLLEQITTVGFTARGIFACPPGGCNACLFIGGNTVGSCYWNTVNEDDERLLIAQLHTNNPEYFL